MARAVVALPTPAGPAKIRWKSEQAEATLGTIVSEPGVFSWISTTPAERAGVTHVVGGWTLRAFVRA